MAHTYDLTTNTGRVRLMIGDTDIVPTTDAQFSDEEIAVFLSLASNSLLLAASYALEAWASTVTAGLTSEKIGDYAYTRKEADAKMALAKKYREEDAMYPSLTWAEMDLSGVDDTTVSEDLE